MSIAKVKFVAFFNFLHHSYILCKPTTNQKIQKLRFTNTFVFMHSNPAPPKTLENTFPRLHFATTPIDKQNHIQRYYKMHVVHVKYTTANSFVHWVKILFAQSNDKHAQIPQNK